MVGGGGALLQDDHVFPDVSTQKIHSHWRFCCYPPPTLLKWAFPRSRRGWKWHPISLRLSVWGGGHPLISTFRVHAIMGLPIHRQRTHRHVLTTVRTMYPYPLSWPVSKSSPRHSSFIRCLWLGPLYPTCAEDHPNHSPDISLKSHYFKYPGQGVELPLYLNWVHWCNQAIIRIEKGGMMSHLPSPPVLTYHYPCHQLDPVPHHCIHHNIKKIGVQWVSLRHPPETLKRCPVVPPCVSHHPKPVPVLPEKTAGPRSHAVTLQDLQAYVPV